MGRALSASLAASGVVVDGPYGKGVWELELERSAAEVVLLAVPDAQIVGVASAIREGVIVGHLSGATPLAVLEPHESFVLHPLLSVTGEDSRFAGAVATVSATSDRASRTAMVLCERLGMKPLRLAEKDRATYHAAASIASNFLVTVEAFAEDLATQIGMPREALVPLVQASVDNWAKLGARQALTGPIVRGDHTTVARQREAVETRMPDRLALFDALVTATEQLADRA